MKKALLLSLSIVVMATSVSYAEIKIKKSHTHNGRTHTHVLPKAGIRHNHNTKRTNKASTNRCSSLPTRYKKQTYGQLLYALESSCHRTLSKNEQSFIAGASRGLLVQCNYPTNIASRIKLNSFLSSSIWVAVSGSDYSNPDFRGTLNSQSQGMFSEAAGGRYAKSLGCTQRGRKLANNIVKYLNRTSSGSKKGANWVTGCATHYSGRYSKAQCQCIADLGRAVIPGIHQTRFSRFDIKRIIKGNPFVGMQVAFRCGIGDY